MVKVHGKYDTKMIVEARKDLSKKIAQGKVPKNVVELFEWSKKAEGAHKVLLGQIKTLQDAKLPKNFFQKLKKVFSSKFRQELKTLDSQRKSLESELRSFEKRNKKLSEKAAMFTLYSTHRDNANAIVEAIKEGRGLKAAQAIRSKTIEEVTEQRLNAGRDQNIAGLGDEAKNAMKMRFGVLSARLKTLQDEERAAGQRVGELVTFLRQRGINHVTDAVLSKYEDLVKSDEMILKALG